MLNLIRMILLLGFIVFLPSISETKIKIYGHNLNVDHGDNTLTSFGTKKTKNHSISYYDLIDEILSSNVSEYSKIKAINEALRLTKIESLRLLRDKCYQSIELKDNLKCLESGVKKFRKNEIFVKEKTAQDIILGSCMKMETYTDEGVCLEGLISKIDIDQIQKQAEGCSFENNNLQKVFCLRSFL